MTMEKSFDDWFKRASVGNSFSKVSIAWLKDAFSHGYESGRSDENYNNFKEDQSNEMERGYLP